MIMQDKPSQLFLTRGKKKISEKNYGEALNEFFNAIYLLKSGDIEQKHQIEVHIGLCYAHEGEYELALKYLESAVQTSYTSKDNNLLALMYTALAVCCNEVGSDRFLREEKQHYYLEAIKNSRKAEDIYLALGKLEVVGDLELFILNLTDDNEFWECS